MQCPATHGRAQIDQFGHGINGHVHSIHSIPNGGSSRLGTGVPPVTAATFGDPPRPVRRPGERRALRAARPSVAPALLAKAADEPYWVAMSPRSYVVTGASTGIGRACVDALARTGAHVWASVRTDADEEALRRDHPDAVTVLRMDVTDADSVTASGQQVLAAGPLAGLVNNAGVALPAPLEHIPIEVFRRQMEVNLIGQLAVTQAMLPALHKSRGQGADARIAMIGSIGGRIAAPMLGAYHASKFGMVGLADTLRAELAPSGIKWSPSYRTGCATASPPPGADQTARTLAARQTVPPLRAA